ncbi:cation:proton antiporter [Candidatus Woesearchaeota archaeon]|nr:cation:proton antiporter [Candidatus Woesearchaeota archaeon]
MASELFSSIEFEMTLFMLITILAYYLSYKLSQSALVLQIVLGIIIGPSVLHLVSGTDFIESIAQFGAIILLFVIGLEFRLEDIAKPKYFLIAIFGVLLPWGGGYLLAKAFGYAFGPALFIGAALTATSIALTANVLKEMGIIRSEIAKAIIGAAVIDDVLGLLVLAFSEQLVGGNVHLSLILWIFLKAMIFLIGGALLGMYFFNPIIHKIDKSPVAKKYPELVFITTMFLVFLYSLVSEYFGLSAIVGAFLAGVSLEGVQLINSQSHRHGAEYLHMVFGSIFFVSLGVIVDFHGFSFGTFFFMIVLTLLAIATKCIGCGVCALFQGYSFQESLVLGIGMSPRGEVAMIVALLGLNAGIIGQDVYLSLMLMSIITTVAVPPILRQLLQRSARLS